MTNAVSVIRIEFREFTVWLKRKSEMGALFLAFSKTYFP